MATRMLWAEHFTRFGPCQICSLALWLSSPALFVQAAALIDLARARLFLGEDMEGEARPFRCFASIWIQQPSAKYPPCHVRDQAFFPMISERCRRLGMMELSRSDRLGNHGRLCGLVNSQRSLLHFWSQFHWRLVIHAWCSVEGRRHGDGKWTAKMELWSVWKLFDVCPIQPARWLVIDLSLELKVW